MFCFFRGFAIGISSSFTLAAIFFSYVAYEWSGIINNSPFIIFSFPGLKRKKVSMPEILDPYKRKRLSGRDTGIERGIALIYK